MSSKLTTLKLSILMIMILRMMLIVHSRDIVVKASANQERAQLIIIRCSPPELIILLAAIYAYDLDKSDMIVANNEPTIIVFWGCCRHQWSEGPQRS